LSVLCLLYCSSWVIFSSWYCSITVKNRYWSV
jgi:hypothetical protein